MSIDAALEADAQLAKGRQPGMRALYDPAMPPEPVIAIDASARDAVLDAAALQVRAAARIGVSLVCVQPGPPLARPALFAPSDRQRIDQIFEDYRVMSMSTGDAKHQRNPRRSVTRWRLLPGLPQSVGLAPV